MNVTVFRAAGSTDGPPQDISRVGFFGQNTISN